MLKGSIFPQVTINDLLSQPVERLGDVTGRSFLAESTIIVMYRSTIDPVTEGRPTSLKIKAIRRPPESILASHAPVVMTDGISR